MSRFDALIEQATARLSADPELQLEVAHELRTHLEDSAAEFRAAGLGEEESAARAAQAFGNPGEVAEKLLAANRKRMRVRRITRVAAGLTLGPVAAALAISFGWGAMTSLVLAIGTVANLGWFRDTGWQTPFSRVAYNHSVRNYQRAIDELPQARRFLFKGDAPPGEYRGPFETAQDLSERWRDDPVYAANYAIEAIRKFNVGQWTDGRQQWSPDGMARTLAILDRCQKIDPDNGYYPLLRGAMLMEAASEEQYDPANDSLAFTYTDARGKEQTNHLVTVRIVDRELFERGIALLHEAAGKPYVRSYAAELADRRLEALPGPSRLSNEVVRVQFARNEGLPFGNYYFDAMNRAGAWACDLAVGRQEQGARSILKDEAAIIRLVASGSRLTDEVLIATQMHGEVTAQTVVIDRRLGLGDAAKSARMRYETQIRDWHALMVRLWGPLETQREHAGVLEEAVWSNPRLLADPQRSAAGRAIDYSVTDQIALAALAILLAIAAIPLLPQLLAPRSGRPVKTPVFIGWRRLLWAVLIGAGVPLLLYGIFAYATPFSGRSYGLLYTQARLPVQYLALAAIIGGLLRVTTNRAARQRAGELGVVMPPPDRGWLIVQVVIAAILATATVAYLATWRLDPNADPDRLSGRGFCELALVFLLGTYALVSLLSSGARPLFERAEAPAGFLRKLSNRFPDWPLYAGFMVAVTASLWLAWLGLPAGTRGTTTLVLLSVAVSLSAVLAFWILMRLIESGRSSSQESRGAPTTTWRAVPITSAVAALAVVVIGFPLLHHVERSALASFDQHLRLWNDLGHSPYAQVREQLVAEPG